LLHSKKQLPPAVGEWQNREGKITKGRARTKPVKTKNKKGELRRKWETWGYRTRTLLSSQQNERKQKKKKRKE